MERAARPREERAVRCFGIAAIEHDPAASRIDQNERRLERQLRKVRGDEHALVFHLIEDTTDLGRGARHETGNGLVDGVQTLKVSRVSFAKSSSAAKRRCDSPCSW